MQIEVCQSRLNAAAVSTRSMKKLPVVLAALLALAAVPLAQAAGIEVTFALGAGHEAAPAVETCRVTIPAGGDGGHVLDAATQAGCISGWSYETFGSSRFVTCIDGICQQLGTFWAYYVNDEMPCGGFCGIDDDGLIGAGDVVEFVYRDWFTPFLPGP